MNTLADVAASTMAATHRRDHDHGDIDSGDSGDIDSGTDACCHPHVVEVVHLGTRAACVCHDCRLDSGFLPRHQAEMMAAGHRDLTRETSVRLFSA